MVAEPAESNPGRQTSHSWKLGGKRAGGAEVLTQMGGQDCAVFKKATGRGEAGWAGVNTLPRKTRPGRVA